MAIYIARKRAADFGDRGKQNCPANSWKGGGESAAIANKKQKVAALIERYSGGVPGKHGVHSRTRSQSGYQAAFLIEHPNFGLGNC